jgi:hypothetical protein
MQSYAKPKAPFTASINGGHGCKSPHLKAFLAGYLTIRAKYSPTPPTEATISVRQPVPRAGSRVSSPPAWGARAYEKPSPGSPPTTSPSIGGVAGSRGFSAPGSAATVCAGCDGEGFAKAAVQVRLTATDDTRNRHFEHSLSTGETSHNNLIWPLARPKASESQIDQTAKPPQNACRAQVS